MTDHGKIQKIIATLYKDSDVDAQVRVLATIVLDLLVEVEALRSAMLDDVDRRGRCHDQSLSMGKSAYQAAYLDTVYLTHNCCGPYSGIEKLLSLYYPEAEQYWRECLFLRRLGFTEEEVARYKEAASEAESFT